MFKSKGSMAQILGEYTPAVKLSNFITSYRVYEVSITEAPVFMIPEGIVEIIFQLGAFTQQTMVKQLDWNIRPNSFVGGLHNQSYKYEVKSSGKMFAIRFKTGCFSFFSKIPVHRLKNHLVTPQNVWGYSGKMLEESILNASTANEQIQIAEDFLIKHFQKHAYQNLVEAISKDLLPHFTESVKTVAQRFNYSPSRFRQIFNQVIGCSPKEYRSIARLHQAIHLYPQTNSLTELSYLLGYFDQAHFTNDCKKITGYSPKALLGRQGGKEIKVN